MLVSPVRSECARKKANIPWGERNREAVWCWLFRAGFDTSNEALGTNNLEGKVL
jgi:hypothetical protein